MGSLWCSVWPKRSKQSVSWAPPLLSSPILPHPTVCGRRCAKREQIIILRNISSIDVPYDFYREGRWLRKVDSRERAWAWGHPGFYDQLEIKTSTDDMWRPAHSRWSQAFWVKIQVTLFMPLGTLSFGFSIRLPPQKWIARWSNTPWCSLTGSLCLKATRGFHARSHWFNDAVIFAELRWCRNQKMSTPKTPLYVSTGG